MFIPKLLTAASLGALCLLAALPLHARAAGQDGQQGMTVTIDPVTKQKRAPTPDELKALRARTPAPAGLQAGQATRPTALAPRAGGARGVRLGEKTLVYEVVTRGADGKLSTDCVQGEAAAEAAMSAPRATPAVHAAPAANDDHQESTHEAR